MQELRKNVTKVLIIYTIIAEMQAKGTTIARFATFANDTTMQCCVGQIMLLFVLP